MVLQGSGVSSIRFCLILTKCPGQQRVLTGRGIHFFTSLLANNSSVYIEKRFIAADPLANAGHTRRSKPPPQAALVH